MKHKGSLPYSQEPSTCPCSEIHKSNLFPNQFLKMYFNITLSSIPRSSKWFPSVRFPNQNSAVTFSFFNICHMPHPAHSQFNRAHTDVGKTLYGKQTVHTSSSVARLKMHNFTAFCYKFVIAQIPTALRSVSQLKCPSRHHLRYIPTVHK